jgi:hypothetical protein
MEEAKEWEINTLLTFPPLNLNKDSGFQDKDRQHQGLQLPTLLNTPQEPWEERSTNNNTQHYLTTTDQASLGTLVSEALTTNSTAINIPLPLLLLLTLWVYLSAESP